MIKGGGFLKSFVLGLFTLLISYFTFGVNSAEAYVRQLNVWGYNPYDQSFNIQITRNGTFLSESMGYTRKMFVLSNGPSAGAVYMWSYNGLPYIYSFYNGTIKQGWFQYYYVCDEIIDPDSDTVTSCSLREVGNNTSAILGSFLSTLTGSDYYYFVQGTACAQGSYQCRTVCTRSNLCISNSSVGSSICFPVDTSMEGIGCGSCSCAYTDMLTGTLGFDTTDPFSNINSAYLYNPPQYGTINEPNNNVNVSYGADATLTGNLVYSSGSTTPSCTNAKARQWYVNNGYAESWCYTYYTESTYQNGEMGFERGLDIDGLWWLTANLRWRNNTGSFMEFDRWFEFWRYSYDTVAKGIHSESDVYGSTNLFNTKVPNALKGYFKFIYDLIPNDSEFLEFCRIVVSNSDYQSAPYTGLNYDSVCRVNSVIGGGGGGVGGGGGGSVSSGGSYNPNNAVAIDWYGFGGAGGSSSSSPTMTQLQDGKSFISDWYGRLKGAYRIPDKSDFGFGILPSYIIWALVGVVIFRFLRTD